MAYTRRNGSAPSTGGNGNGGNSWGLYLAGAALLGGLVFLGDGDSPIKDLSGQMLAERMTEVQKTTQADADERNAAESARRAEEIAGDGTGCIRVANGDPLPDGRPMGSVHVGLSVGQRVVDPATRAPLAKGACVQDHLGFVGYIGDDGYLGEIYYSPNLVEHQLWTDTTRQVVEGAQ